MMMMISSKPTLLFILFILCLSTQNSISSSPHKRIPRLSPFYRENLYFKDQNEILSTKSEQNSSDLVTYFYNQTLDHFNFAPQSYANFQQRYVVDSTHWGGANSTSPIFAYLGAEASIDGDLSTIGLLKDNAPDFNALLVFIEHRFYGKSRPYGLSMEDALNNETLRGYFSSEQALADYAEVLLHVKKQFSAHYSPIIVFGGSYGGMLASWFRLKYPHVALGALASSAPILYFDNITPQNGYYSIVTQDFKAVSENCYQTIRDSWAEIDRIASQPNGTSILSQRFRTCSPLNKSSEIKDYLDTMYSIAAQYDTPPKYPVTMVCKGIDEAPNGTDIIGRVFAGVVSYRGNRTCYNTSSNNFSGETTLGWNWQTCSELVIPIGRGENDTMFPSSPFVLDDYVASCNASYGVPPRPHWITTYYGGHHIKLALQRFGSNIIFSNGLQDPYSSGGVLENLSDSLLAVTTTNGSHCLDILKSKNTDPEWLVLQRNIELKIIGGWIAQYQDDLKALQHDHAVSR